MASGKTPRRSLPFMKSTDPDKLSADIESLALALDQDCETFQGKLSERPAAALRGRIYVVQGDASAEANGVVWWDTGSTWIAVNSNPSAWTGLTLGPKMGENPAEQTVRARIEAGGNFVRLRGVLLTKVGEELKIGETAATLPAGFRPPGLVACPTVTGQLAPVTVNIATSGVMTVTTNVPGNTGIGLDGITFNLT